MLSQPRPGELVKQLTNHRTTEPPVRQKAQDSCNTVNGTTLAPQTTKETMKGTTEQHQQDRRLVGSLLFWC